MKLLYISCHETLEYDELRILTELGFDCFSIGYWMNPHETKSKVRPNILIMKPWPEKEEEFKKTYLDYKLPRAEFNTGRVRLTQEFLKDFDIIVNCWYPDNLAYGLEVCSDKVMIHRTIDIIAQRIENIIAKYHSMKPFHLIRMSPMELIDNPKIKGEAIIRQCVDEKIFKGWKGTEQKVVTTINRAKHRYDVDFQLYEYVTQLYNRVLVGEDNDTDYSVSGLSTESLVELMQNCRVNYVQPRIGAAMTYGFMEAMMCGCPVVTIGTQNNGPNWEAPQLIKNGVNGFCASSKDEAIQQIELLMNDEALANRISKNARKLAKSLFTYEIAKENWLKFFKDIKIL